MKKIAFSALFATVTCISAQAQTEIIKNSMDSFSYAAGVNIAKTMQQQGVTDMNTAMLKQAIDDVFSGNNLSLTEEQCNMSLQNKLQEFAARKLDMEKEKGKNFLMINKKRKKVVELPNGLQYEIIKSGKSNGIKPKAIDTVVVHYVGKTVEGKEFDSSVGRGEPATFPLNRVIPGWTAILQHMTIGDKWIVFIPSELAYGERGAGAAIPANATLIFEIELLDIKPAS